MLEGISQELRHLRCRRWLQPRFQRRQPFDQRISFAGVVSCSSLGQDLRRQAAHPRRLRLLQPRDRRRQCPSTITTGVGICFMLQSRQHDPSCRVRLDSSRAVDQAVHQVGPELIGNRALDRLDQRRGGLLGRRAGTVLDFEKEQRQLGLPFERQCGARSRSTSIWDAFARRVGSSPSAAVTAGSARATSRGRTSGSSAASRKRNRSASPSYPASCQSESHSTSERTGELPLSSRIGLSGLARLRAKVRSSDRSAPSARSRCFRSARARCDARTAKTLDTTAPRIRARATEAIKPATTGFRRVHSHPRSTAPTGRARSAPRPASGAGPPPAPGPSRTAAPGPCRGTSGRSPPGRAACAG